MGRFLSFKTPLPDADGVFFMGRKIVPCWGTRHVPEKWRDNRQVSEEWRESVKKRSGAGASGRSARKGEPES